MMEATTSKTSANFYQSKRRNNPEDLHTRRRENLKSHKYKQVRKCSLRRAQQFWRARQNLDRCEWSGKSPPSHMGAKTHACLHVKLPLLFNFNPDWNESTNWSKTPQVAYQMSWKSIQWLSSCRMWIVGQTDMAKLIRAFLQLPVFERAWKVV
jgi:hypothetical protein